MKQLVNLAKVLKKLGFYKESIQISNLSKKAMPLGKIYISEEAEDPSATQIKQQEPELKILLENVEAIFDFIHVPQQIQMKKRFFLPSTELRLNEDNLTEKQFFERTYRAATKSIENFQITNLLLQIADDLRRFYTMFDIKQENLEDSIEDIRQKIFDNIKFLTINKNIEAIPKIKEHLTLIKNNNESLSNIIQQEILDKITEDYLKKNESLSGLINDTKKEILSTKTEVYSVINQFIQDITEMLQFSQNFASWAKDNLKVESDKCLVVWGLVGNTESNKLPVFYSANWTIHDIFHILESKPESRGLISEVDILDRKLLEINGTGYSNLMDKLTSGVSNEDYPATLFVLLTSNNLQPLKDLVEHKLSEEEKQDIIQDIEYTSVEVKNTLNNLKGKIIFLP
jgi:hypothetical protein